MSRVPFNKLADIVNADKKVERGEFIDTANHDAAKKKYESDMKIEKIETAKNNIPLRANMKDGTLLPFPFSLIFSGRSGSGKTNLLINLLTNPKMYGKYFHYMMVFSPTAKIDDLYKSLKIPDENLKTTFEPADLEHIIKMRMEQVKKKGIDKVAQGSRLLIIFDDTIANQNFLKSKEALEMFTLLRHYLVSVIILTQKYNKIPPAQRDNASGLFIFPSNRNEVELMKDELCPPFLDKKTFEKVVDYATNEKYSFLFINNKADNEQRYRKNLTEVINLNKFRSGDNKYDDNKSLT